MKAPIGGESSRKISFWSLFFAVFAVVAHCSWRPESVMDRVVVLLASGTVSRMVVQFFFTISGYFLARHFDEAGWWRRETGKRVWSLGVPYVLWTTVLAVTLWVETRELMGIGGLGLNLCKIPALAPLWYVRCLMLFILTLPLWLSVLDRWRGALLAGTYAVALGLMVVAGRCGWSDEGGVGGFFAYGFSVEGLFYFLTGVFLQRYGQPVVSRRVYWFLMSVGLTLLAVKVALHLIGLSPGFSMNVLITPFVLAGLWGLVRPGPLPSVLNGVAFPIYIMHAVVLSVLRNAGGSYQPRNPWLELALGTVVPIVAYRLLRRFARRLSDVLFGGR